MKTDNAYTPATDGLAAQAFAAAATRHHAREFSALDPHKVKRGSLCGKPMISKAESEPNTHTATRKSRAVRTGEGIQSLLDKFVYDYYQATIPNPDGKNECRVGGAVETDAVRRAVKFFELHGLRAGNTTSGGAGYANGLSFARPGEQEAVGFLASGSSQGYMPNITIKGGRGACADLAPSIQADFPGLRLTRADTSLDLMCGEDGWRKLLSLSRRFAQARSMNRPDIRGIDIPEDGRTFYLGSRSSTVFVRVYEKGKHLNAIARKAGKPELASPDWVRIEFQFGNYPGRLKAGKAAMTPAQLICSHDWPRFWIAMAANELDLTDGVERAALHKGDYEPIVKTIDTTADHGVKQYGRTFIKLAARDIIDAEFDGRVEDAVICPDRLLAGAAEHFLQRLQQIGIVDDYIKDARLHVAETLDDRAEAIAIEQRDRRVRLLLKQAEDRVKHATQIEASSNDHEGVQRIRAKADDLKRRANEIADEVYAWAAE